MMLCWFYRWKMSSMTFDGDGSLSSFRRRHLLRCERCREFFRMSVALGERLSLEAAMTCPDVPGRLQRRIMRRISLGGQETHRPSPGVWRFVAAACLAAVVLATAVLVPVMRRRIDTARVGRRIRGEAACRPTGNHHQADRIGRQVSHRLHYRADARHRADAVVVPSQKTGPPGGRAVFVIPQPADRAGMY